MRELERGSSAVNKILLASCMISLMLQVVTPLDMETGLNQRKIETALLIILLPIGFLTVLPQAPEETDTSRKIIAGVIILVVTIMCVYLMTVFVAKSSQKQAPPSTAPYRNPNLSPEERAADLLSRMTLGEKIGQMTLVDRQSISSISDISTYNLGGLLSGGGSCPDPNTPHNWARMYNRYQKQAVEGTRLGIPILYGIDAVHGHNNVYGAVIFPHNVGMGATWNPELVEKCAHITAVEVRATGIRWTFSPCIDVARDDRWGRTYESFGEDPYLVKTMAISAVKGYQGAGLDRDDTVLATAKHFMGSGGTKDGKDQGDFQGPLRILREQHLEPFIGAVSAGVGSVMASYCSINGQKIHGIKFFLTDVLKVELGFKGLLVSDWEAIGQVDSSYRNAVKKCVEAGIDMAMVPSTWKMFQENLKDLVNSGEIPVSRIDEAVYRILLVKFRLGLFENPYVDESLSSVVGSAVHREVARQAVRESIVLLKNNGILPIPKNVSTIFVAGPNANDIGNQCGGWTITWQGSSGDITIGTTILEAIRKTVSPSTVIIFDENASNVAGPYDVGIVVVGETPYAEFLGDRESLDLPEEQLKIIDRVVASGTPTVVIMVAGRPLTGIENRLSQWDAFLMAWLPGTEGQGVADVLFGNYNPSGKLPRSWPRSTAQEPINYDHRPGEEYDPLFEFGYGLSYTTFEYSCLNVTPAEPHLTGNISISVNVRNTGPYSGSEVVQVYVSDVESSLSTPVKKLYRFRKITLQPGEMQTVSFTIPVSELGFYTDGPGKTIEEGVFIVTVGGLTASFTARK